MQREADYRFPRLDRRKQKRISKKSTFKVLLLFSLLFTDMQGMEPDEAGASLADAALLAEFNGYLGSQNQPFATWESLYRVQFEPQYAQSPLAITPLASGTLFEVTLNRRGAKKPLLQTTSVYQDRVCRYLYQDQTEQGEQALQLEIGPRQGGDEKLLSVKLSIGEGGERRELNLQEIKSIQVEEYSMQAENLRSCINILQEWQASPALTYQDELELPTFKIVITLLNVINEPVKRLPITLAGLFYKFDELSPNKQVGIFAQLKLFEGWGSHFIELCQLRSDDCKQEEDSPFYLHTSPIPDPSDLIHYNGDSIARISRWEKSTYNLRQDWLNSWDADSLEGVQAQPITLAQKLSEWVNHLNHNQRIADKYIIAPNPYWQTVKLIMPRIPSQEIPRGCYKISNSERIQSLAIYSGGRNGDLTILQQQDETWTLYQTDNRDAQQYLSNIDVSLYMLTEINWPHNKDKEKYYSFIVLSESAPLQCGCLPEGVYKGIRNQDKIEWTAFSDCGGGNQYRMNLKQEFMFPIPPGMSRYDYLNEISYFPFYRSITLEDSITELSGEQLRELVGRMNFLEKLKLIVNPNGKISTLVYHKLEDIGQAIAKSNNPKNVTLTLKSFTSIEKAVVIIGAEILGNFIAQIPYLKELDMVIPYIPPKRHLGTIEGGFMGPLLAVLAYGTGTVAGGVAAPALLLFSPLIGYAMGGIKDRNRLRNDQSYEEHLDLAKAIGNSRTLETIIIRGFKHQHDKNNFRKKILEGRPDLREEDITFPE